MVQFPSYVIERLMGMDRNKATGDDPDGVPLPDEVYNLVPDRRGAWSPLGRIQDKGVENLGSLTEIGDDVRGLSSFENAGGDGYSLFDGLDITASAETYASLVNTAHIPRFGAYTKHDQWFGVGGDGTTYLDPPENGIVPTMSSTTISDTTGTAFPDIPGGETITCVAVVNDSDPDWSSGSLYLAGTDAGNIWASTDDLATASIVDSSFPNAVEDIAYGAGRFIAVGTAPGNDGHTRYSTDGATWNAPTTDTNRPVRAVVYDPTSATPGMTWIVAGNQIYRTTDGGDTYSVVDNTDTPKTYFGVFCFAVPVDVLIEDIAVNDAGQFVAIGGQIIGLCVPGSPIATSDDGISWNWTRGSNGLFARCVAGAGNTWIMGSNKADIHRSTDGGQTWQWIINTIGNDDNANPTSVVWSGTNWFVGTDTGNVFQSVDGQTFTAVPMAITGGVVDLFETTGGGIMGATDTNQVFFLGEFGTIKKGTYTIFYVSSIETPAGRLVLNVGNYVEILAGDVANQLVVELEDSATIAAGSGYPPGDHAAYQAFLEEYGAVDIYLRSEPDVTGDEADAEDVPGFDSTPANFAFRFDITDQSQTRAITEIPVGRELGDDGNVAIVGFGPNSSGSAVLHGERVWAVYSTDALDYVFADSDTELELPAGRAGVTLGYSEIGYLNLARVDNYEVIVPSESDTFVGMVSTPSGLLAFFSNEVHLISGDPNLGNVEIELYPDTVGADPGTKPTKLGGIAFCVWKGEVYALTGGRAQRLSRPIDSHVDKVVDMVPEPRTKSLLVRTESNKVYRYMIDDQFWLRDTIKTASFLLPHSDDDGTRFMAADGSVDYVDITHTGTPETPYFIYNELDFGDKNRLDAFYGLMVPVSGYDTATAELDANIGDPTAIPYMLVQILDTDPALDPDSVSPDMLDPNDATFSQRFGRLNRDRYNFSGRRKTKARQVGIAVVLQGMGFGSTIEPQLRFKFVPGAHIGTVAE